MTGDAARLETVEIRDYRNLTCVELELPASGLTLVGDNGQGKTNFLEAVYYFQLLRSARGARDVDAAQDRLGWRLRCSAHGDKHGSINISTDRSDSGALGHVYFRITSF